MSGTARPGLASAVGEEEALQTVQLLLGPVLLQMLWTLTSLSLPESEAAVTVRSVCVPLGVLCV